MRGSSGLDLVKPKRPVACDAAGRVHIVRADVLALHQQEHGDARWPTIVILSQCVWVVLRFVGHI
jgi:hypothetical protein